ncbi:MAG: hydrolase [Methylobacter sp.]|nr:MAG: hydrolase [Methylobacter sp.]PPD24234.1 MAG: hydrolase [Methylobacter sp.]PPD37601.1 MAG: hydrolase [Methylomonas sp.]
MKNRFDLIIFDWDGTLIDSIGWIVHCLQTAAISCGCPVPSDQQAKDVIGLSIEVAMDTLFPDADANLRNRLVECYSSTYFSRRISRDDLFPGVYDMLVHLKDAGYKLAVATGKTRNGLIKALEATETGNLFEITRCADETASKPDPKMIHQILAHTQTEKDRSLMVGDSVHDLKMACNAQVASIGVACGVHTESVLKNYQPLMCLSQPAELINIFGGTV